MIRQMAYVICIGVAVGVGAFITMRFHLPVGPSVIGISLLPIFGLILAKRSLKRAIPDIIFGSIDTGLLTIPAIFGGIYFGVLGAIVGGVVGDALTDGIAGFFEGAIAKWLRSKGIEEGREPVTTSLGKMAGCLMGCGVVLTIALFLGLHLPIEP